MNLNIKEYTYSNCQYELDRYYNVSVNIMLESLKKYMNEVPAWNKLQKNILNFVLYVIHIMY